MFLIKNCSVTGIFDKSTEHVGTKEIVPYQPHVPPLEGSLLEVLLYSTILAISAYVWRRAISVWGATLIKSSLRYDFCAYMYIYVSELN